MPKLTARYGNGLLLAGGLVTTTIGMLWLSRLSGETSYPTGLALPMILIGAGQGATLSPLTAAGIAGARSENAGAASGLVDVFHQLGGSLGRGILVTVFAAADAGGMNADDLLAHRVSVALTVARAGARARRRPDCSAAQRYPRAGSSGRRSQAGGRRHARPRSRAARTARGIGRRWSTSNSSCCSCSSPLR